MHAMDMDKRDATHEHKNSDDVNPTVKTDEPTLAFVVALPRSQSCSAGCPAGDSSNPDCWH